MSLRRFFPDLGITKAELKKAVQRDRFSDYLPWVAYDPETKITRSIRENLARSRAYVRDVFGV